MLSNVNFKEIIEEMKRLCPTLYEIVFSILEMDIGTEQKIPTMALVYSLTMFKRFREMSLLQRLNTLLLIDGDANQEVKKTPADRKMFVYTVGFKSLSPVNILLPFIDIQYILTQ